MRICPNTPMIVSIIVMLTLTTLASAQGAPAPAAGKAAPTLNWVDAQSGVTLFSLADIVRFDWDHQLFEVTPACASALLSLPIAQYRDFSVKDDEGLIYRGRLYRSNAREGYDGCTLLLDQGAKQTLPAAPFFILSGGYPAGGGPHDQDRFAPRLKTILEDAKLLAPIPESDLPHTLKWMGHTWVGGDQALGASPGIFPATVRMGKAAYLHIIFTKGNHPDVKFDQLLIRVKCEQKASNYAVTHELATITTPPLANDICVCKFTPWKGMVAPPAPDNQNAPAAVKTSLLPHYPKDAVNENRGGKLIVALVINTDGKAGNPTIVQSTGSEDLDRSAVRALHRWTFVPAVKGGQVSSSTMRVQFEFADERVQQTILPPDLIEVTAKPGKLSLTVTFTTMKKTADGFTPSASWSLPPYEVNLLPAEPAPAPAVPPVAPPAGK